MKNIFKEGDRVYCHRNECWGTVDRVNDSPTDDYPVTVYLDREHDKYKYYTRDGKRYAKDQCPTLFFTEDVEFPKPERPVEYGEIVMSKVTKELCVVLSRGNAGRKTLPVAFFKNGTRELGVLKSVDVDKLVRLEGLIISNLEEVLGSNEL